MTVEIISQSISTKVWDRTGIELATPGSDVKHASVARHHMRYAARHIQILIEHSVSSSGDPDQTPHSVATDLGLHFLPMSHKKLY